MRKIMYTPVNASFTILKWGLRGGMFFCDGFDEYHDNIDLSAILVLINLTAYIIRIKYLICLFGSALA